MRSTLRISVSVVVVCFAVALHGQKPPVLELGFKPDRVYNYSGIDAVNVMNGNLLVDVPIGRELPVSSHLSLGFHAFFNGKVWDHAYIYDTTTPGQFWILPKPNLRSNAGPGWRVSLGRLLPPTDSSLTYPESQHSQRWVYEGPSGDEHAFDSAAFGGTNHDPDATVQFSTDGTFLRMVTVDSDTRKIEFPDGLVHTFKIDGDAWRLRSMADRFGNFILIAYTYGTGNRVTKWTLTDVHHSAFGSNREQTVVFEHFPEMGDSVDDGQNVDYIDLRGLDGTTVRYDFNYTEYDVPNHCRQTYVPPAPGAPVGSTTRMHLLTSISLPDTTSYEFVYHLESMPSCQQAVLKEITLPTKGKLAYTYQGYEYPDPNTCSGPDVDTLGIKTRTIDGNEWKYLLTRADAADYVDTDPEHYEECPSSEPDTHPPPNIPRRWNRTSVLTPADASGKHVRTDHYFNTYVQTTPVWEDQRLHADDSSLFQFSLPATAGWPGVDDAKKTPPQTETAQDESATDTGAADTRFLSSQTWSGCTSTGDCTDGQLLRSNYSRYEFYPRVPVRYDRHPISERTLFHDDAGCGGTCWVQTDYDDADSVGNWGTVTVSSNFPGASDGTTGTTFAPHTNASLRSSATPWVLRTYSAVTATIGTKSATTAFAFDANGLLKRSRVYASTASPPATGAHDLITDYSYSDGNLQDLKSYGGDTQSVGTDTDLVNLSLPSVAAYWNRYRWSKGVADRDEVYDPATSAAYTFRNFDYTVNPSTGLVTGSKSPDEMSTAFTYSNWGRLSTVTPPGQATSSYTYTPATTTSYATIVETRSDITNTWEYDRLGRVRLIKKTIPAPSGQQCVEQSVQYDALGRKSAESTWRGCGSSSQSTTYEYDAFGRLTKATLPDTTVSTVAYEGVRTVTRSSGVATGAAADTTVRVRDQYDHFGRLVSVTENFEGREGEVITTYSYDAGNRLTGVSMTGAGATQTREFAYDGRGFLVSETHPEIGTSGNGTISYPQYDARGHATKKTIGSSVDLRYTFDAGERLIKVFDAQASRDLKLFSWDCLRLDVTQACPTVTDRARLVATARYNHDPVLGSVAVTESYQYDAATGLPARRDQTVGDGVVNGVTQFKGETFFFLQTYNTLGLPDTLTYPCRTASGACRPEDNGPVVTHSYTHGLLTAVSPWASKLTYQASGLVAAVTHGSGAAAVVEKWEGDASGMPRPKRIYSTSSDGTQTLWEAGTYAYDGSGNVKSITNGAAGTTFSYDGFGRLANWRTTQPGGAFDSTTRGYDPFGNFVVETYQGCVPSSTAIPRCRTTSSVPRGIVGTTNHYADVSYDVSGNVTSPSSGVTYTWDPLGMMTTATVQGKVFRYLYTADEERIAAVERVPVTNGTKNRTTFAVRGFGNQLLTAWTDDWTHGFSVFTRKEDEIWRGSLLLARSSESSAMNYTLDHLGSPRLITNASGGVVAEQEFDPFGAGGFLGSGALQFTGHERDQANIGNGNVDLPDYMHARYYDKNGRFLSVDQGPFHPERPQSWNRYSYVENNPVLHDDPDGRERPLPRYIREGWSSQRMNIEAAADRAEARAFLGRVTHYDEVREAATGLDSASNGERAMAAGVIGIAVLDIASNFLQPEKAGAMEGAEGLGLRSFSAFKRMFGAAGTDVAWHHVVEQTTSNAARFGPEALHNVANVIRVDVATHTKISAYYSSKQTFTGGKTVRDWLRTQSYQQQYEFGMQVLRDLGVVK